LGWKTVRSCSAKVVAFSGQFWPKYCLVNIPLAGGRTLTSGFSYIEGTNFKDEIKQFCAKDVRLQLFVSLEIGSFQVTAFALLISTQAARSTHSQWWEALAHINLSTKSLSLSLCLTVYLFTVTVKSH
jgi:hypothetical protein